MYGCIDTVRLADVPSMEQCCVSAAEVPSMEQYCVSAADVPSMEQYCVSACVLGNSYGLNFCLS